MTQGVESFLIWLACLIGFGASGVVCTFFPQIVQRAGLNAPTPRWKFIPKPQDMWAVRAMGGFASKSYRIQIRVIGVLNLVATALLILVPLGAFR
ncbi:MAG: hypothetical protein ABSF14_11850 [Terriglobia bacterium]